jgi:hypothetical protein
LALEEIGQFLGADQMPSLDILERRLREVNRQIVELRRQQHAIAGMMRLVANESPRTVISHEDWQSMLRRAGLSDAQIQAWHAEFERHSPEAHRYFLISLGLPEEEVASIRSRTPQRDG